MTARRRFRCDCCSAHRLRWQRLCGGCFGALPALLRGAVIDTWKRGDKRAWRAAKRAALDFLATHAARHAHTISAERAYQLTNARLGERE